MKSTIQTVNPTSEDIITTYNIMTWDEIDQVIDSVHHNYLDWRKRPYSDRQKLMHTVGDLLTQRRERFAKTITMEMGKPIGASRSEVDKCVAYTHYMADHVNEFLAPRVITSEHIKSYVTYEPQGIVFAIMPWNFPLWQVMRFLVPNLLSGNAAILSHAPISTGCSLMIDALFQQAGIPAFRSIINSHDDAATVIADPRIIGVTLTGSEQTGKIVGAQAGHALKKCVLELGGSDPYIILEDANLERAATLCVASRMLNAGQVCIAAKRIIAVKEIHDPFVTLVTQKLAAFKMGDPTLESTTLGPLARRDLRDKVHDQVQQSISQGAHCIMGGEIPSRKGFYYPATLLTHLPPKCIAANEEIFGPVVSIIRADDEQDAIRIANSTRFGLGASVFTSDIQRGERIARDELIAGTAVVNAMVTSDQRFPFGGTKCSGYGREISMEGSIEFLNTKTIIVDR